MISVIVTCYNEGNLLLRALDSLKRQTFQDFETIIVNDFSFNQETLNVCKTIERQGYKVIWNKRNLGLSGARNAGIEASSGDIIVPFDADDTLPYNAIKIINNAFKSNDNIDMLFGNYLRIDIEINNKIIVDCSSITNISSEIDPYKLMQNWIFLGTSPYKKRLWKDLKGYSSEFTYTCQDVDYLMKAILFGAKVFYINKIIYHWHKSKNGMNNIEILKKDLSVCYFRNYEFIFRFASINDSFSLALKYSDAKKLKQLSAKMRKENTTNIYSKVFNITPIFIMPILIWFFSIAKTIKNKIIRRIQI